MTYEGIDQLTDKQIDDLMKMYQSEWWTIGRERADVEVMLKHSSIIVGFCEADTRKLVAFGRVLTDYVDKALVFDVIVESSLRGSGLGAALIDRIVRHDLLKAVRHFELYCRADMVPFYRKWGFSDWLDDLRFMRLIGQPGLRHEME